MVAILSMRTFSETPANFQTCEELQLVLAVFLYSEDSKNSTNCSTTARIVSFCL